MPNQDWTAWFEHQLAQPPSDAVIAGRRPKVRESDAWMCDFRTQAIFERSQQVGDSAGQMVPGWIPSSDGMSAVRLSRMFMSLSRKLQRLDTDLHRDQGMGDTISALVIPCVTQG